MEIAWTPTQEVLEQANVVRLMRRLGLDDYRDLARKAAGRPLKIQVGAAPAADPAPPAPAEAKKRRLLEEAAREPAVQEALDLFGGKVVEVRENKP